MLEEQSDPLGPRITVVTVHLGPPEPLLATLESVVSQTRRPFEHLVVDGGSGEVCRELLRRFDDRLSWWVSEPDRGTFAAMNKALQHATGDWVHFLNSGDCYARPDTLERVAEQLRSGDRVVWGDVLLRRRSGMVERWRQPPALLHGSLFRNVCHQAVFYARDVLQARPGKAGSAATGTDSFEGPFDLGFRVSADADLHLRLAGSHDRGQMRRIDVPVAVYEEGGLSFRARRELLDERGRQIRRHLTGWRRSFNLANLTRQRWKQRLRRWRGEEPGRLLVLHLRRRGGAVAYGRAIVEHSEMPLDLVVSGDAIGPVPEGARAISTYRSTVGFLVASVFRLPILLLRLLLALLRGRYSALYLPSFHPWNLGAQWLFRAFARPTITTEHDGRVLPGEAWPLEDWLRLRSLRWASRAIFLSEFARSSAGHDSDASSFVVPLGVLTHGLDEPLRLHPARALRVLFLGRVTSRKGVDLLIEGVAQVPSGVVERLTVAGQSGDDQCLPQIDDRLVRIDRWLDDDEIVQLVRAHDVLVLPYRVASQSGVVMIGMAGALPLICTRVGGLEEQLGDDGALWIEGSAEAIREGLIRLQADPSLFESLSRSLIRRREAVAWPEVARRVGEIIAWAPVGGSELPWLAQLEAVDSS